MFDILEPIQDVVDQEDAHHLLRDLEQNTPDQIRSQRAHFRVVLKSAIVLQPGNASELLNFKIKGVTGDISESGCSLLAPVPVRVGDIYRLTFDVQRVDLPMMFARCLRCRLVREDAFEAGFTFFSNIALPDTLISQAESAPAH